jgi:hypothetical protein
MKLSHQSGEELDRLMGELHVSPTLAALMRDGKDAADD